MGNGGRIGAQYPGPHTCRRVSELDASACDRIGFFGVGGAAPGAPTALPMLALWACSKAVSGWLGRAPATARNRTSRKNVAFLRRTSLSTWRYFAEYSTAEHHWLIPDNVQEEPAAVAARVSPTNIGFLLNARQVACEFGYLTVPEFAEQTLRTLAT